MALDRKAFEHALTRWVEALLSRPIAAAASLPEAYALDGKSARGSFDGLQKAVHLLSLLAHESGLTLVQAAVPNGGEDKTNEHKAALRLLEGLVLQGRLVTGDAIFCQRDFCRQVIDAGGDYLVFVKDNQPTLLNDIRLAFAPPAGGAFSPSAATNLGSRHGHGEDASRIRKRSGPEVMAAFRNATIGLLRTMGVTNIAEALRRNASQVGGLFARLGILKQ